MSKLMKADDFKRFAYNSVYTAGYECAKSMTLPLAREFMTSVEFERQSEPFQDGFIRFIEDQELTFKCIQEVDNER